MPQESTFDARRIPLLQKLPQILKVVDSLGPGETLILINDIDPKPLKFKLGQSYDWHYTNQTPGEFTVRITRK